MAMIMEYNAIRILAGRAKLPKPPKSVVPGTLYNHIMCLIIILLTCGISWAKLDIYTTHLKSTRRTIEIGEPLTIEVVRKYHNFDDVLKRSFEHSMRIAVEKLESTQVSTFRERPKNIRKNIEKGEATFTLSLWYNSWGEIPYQTYFTTTGKYKVYIKAYPSSVLNVTVKEASKKTKKAMDLLADPNDRSFLMGKRNIKNKDARIAKLEEVVKKCENSLFSKIAAGRLGIVYFEDFMKKNPSVQKYRKNRKESGEKDQLLDKVDDYLKKATKLPDDMRIREEVIYFHSIVKFLKDDFDKASQYMDELSKKYPKGRYGKKASKAKAELKQIKEREKLQQK